MDKIGVILLLLAIFRTDCYKVREFKNKNGDETKVVTRRFSTIKPNDTTMAMKGQKKIINWKSLGEDRFETATEETSEATEATTKLHITTRKWVPVTKKNEPSTIKNLRRNYTHGQEGVCEHFKYGAVTFDFKKMSDVWQTVYYQLPEKVHCFKIHIRKLSQEEKKNYSVIYGNFSGIVNWDECNLEVKSESESSRKHFLQGINEDQGVMDNIIIIQDDTNEPKVHEESADQWLVVNNMLLMRDCDTGGVVVFAKVPHSPRVSDIETALKLFNEEHINGRLACDDDEVVKPFDAEEDINEQIN